MISYKVDEKSTVQLNVYNLTDKLYYAQYFGGNVVPASGPLGLADLPDPLVIAAASRGPGRRPARQATPGRAARRRPP